MREKEIDRNLEPKSLTNELINSHREQGMATDGKEVVGAAKITVP
jgi:hypothetical protein